MSSFENFVQVRETRSGLVEPLACKLFGDAIVLLGVPRYVPIGCELHKQEVTKRTVAMVSHLLYTESEGLI